MVNKWINKLKCKLKRCIGPNDIQGEQLNQMLKQGAILIDVRSLQEYKEGHLNGAICIPEYEMKTQIDKVVKDKCKLIIVYCDSGGRSKKAQKVLQNLKYNNVYNLWNGWNGYIDK